MLLHPIFSVLVHRPDLLVDHVAGYANLVREESASVSGEVAKRAIAWGIAILSFTAFLVLTGVGAMLAALHDRFHWALVLVPLAALALAIAAARLARRPLPSQAFTELRAQLDADAQALRGLGGR